MLPVKEKSTALAAGVSRNSPFNRNSQEFDNEEILFWYHSPIHKFMLLSVVLLNLMHWYISRQLSAWKR